MFCIHGDLSGVPFGKRKKKGKQGERGNRRGIEKESKRKEKDKRKKFSFHSE